MDDRASHPNRQVGRERFNKAVAQGGQGVDPAITLAEYRQLSGNQERSMWGVSHKKSNRSQLRPVAGGLTPHKRYALESEE